MTGSAEAPVYSLACQGRSHAGRVRPDNQDSFALAAERGIAAVADGMGGHDSGRQVADLAVAALCRVSPAASLEGTVERARAALNDANGKVWRSAHQHSRTMGATLAAAVVDRGRLAVIWAGDSRAYAFRDGFLYRLTRDHSAISDLIDAGRLAPSKAATHPLRHVVTRAVGAAETLEIEVGYHSLCHGDLVLLSTDGLHGAISEDEIERCLDDHRMDALDPLIETALAAGAPDNVTAVLLEV
ncbi:MAG TPA: protein phosphatase 2C domain-containing protein [Reyranella sp.]|nr:protein phosphatase 2C domain-containing protein [Reyranella sp.]